MSAVTDLKFFKGVKPVNYGENAKLWGIMSTADGT